MNRPGWTTFVGILMVLIGGCGAYSNIQNINVKEIAKFQEDLVEEIGNEEQRKKEIKDTLETNKTDTTVINERTPEEDSLAEERIKNVMFVDTIIKDSLGNIDTGAMIKETIKMSDYRIAWTERFGYIGLILSLLFIVSGIFFFTRKKYTLQLAILTLVLSLTLSIFRILIYKADEASGTLIDTFGNVGIYFSMFFIVAVLIIIMVMDKSYYTEEVMREDYYD